jgi:iron-sulfur cluster assembly protein
MTNPIITVTDTAKDKIIESVRSRGGNTLGIRIGVNTRGCSGHSYVLEFCEKEDPVSEKVSIDSDVSIFIDPKSLLYILGLQIDWKKEKLKEGFVFENPNAKGSCGCGESFNV